MCVSPVIPYYSIFDTISVLLIAAQYLKLFRGVKVALASA